MKNNRGLSYVELLVVIGVMILVVGISALSMSLISRNNATKMGDKMVTLLRKARTSSLAKGSENGAFHIRKVGNNYECAVGDINEIIANKEIEFETIGSGVQLYYYNPSDGLMPIVPSDGTVTSKFSQSNGSVISYSIGSEILDSFSIYKNEEPAVRIMLYEVTGKCEMMLE